MEVVGGPAVVVVVDDGGEEEVNVNSMFILLPLCYADDFCVRGMYYLFK